MMEGWADNPRRFAMVTTFYPPYNFGGDGMYIQRLARSLVRRGHHVEVIHDTDGYRLLSGNDPQPETESEEDGVRVHRLRSERPALAALAVQQTGKPIKHRQRIAEILDDRFDVIHFHNISLVGGPGVWAIGQGIKVHTAHEHWMVCPTHVLWRYNREICDERHCLKCLATYRRPPQLWRHTGHLDRMASNVDAFMTLSQSAIDNHRNFGFQHDFELVPSYLPDEPPLDDRPSPHHRHYYLCVGRLENIKGFDQVIPQMKGRDCDLLIAGDGEDRTKLEALAEGIDNVVFLGRKSPDDLRYLYKHALALVVPSRCYEVFPLVVLEAFREGTPIIARDVGPFPEIVRATDAGLLFEDDSDLSDALGRLSSDETYRRSLGANALESFEARWSESVALAHYFKLLGRIAARKAAFRKSEQ